MDIQQIILNIAQSAPGFLLAIVAHEWAHGYMAMRFGDDTAKNEGRLTFNPGAHIDMMGTVIFPLIGVVLGWAVIGWARPVPVNPNRFSNVRKGIFWVSFAGPLANFTLGFFSSLIYAIVATQVSQTFGYYEIILKMLSYSIFINFLLGVFNLIPLPPLDGSRMVSSFLKGETLLKYEQFARYTPMIFLIIISLSMMGISTLGRILAPAAMIGNKLTMYFLYLLG